MSEADLITTFYNHLPSIEGRYPYMYLDSEGYLTIGLGVLLGKLNEGGKAIALAHTLSELPAADISTEKIATLTPEQMAPLYKKDSAVIEALGKAQKLHFQEQAGERTSTKYYTIRFTGAPLPLPINLSDKNNKIQAAFDDLLRASVLLKAQQIRAKRSGKIYVGSIAASFFTCKTMSGNNNLVISDHEIRNLAMDAIQEKIDDLKHYFPSNASTNDPGFDGYPLPVRAALLDMSYNMGAKKLAGTPSSMGGFETFTKLVKEQKWEEILKKNEYHRRPPVNEERNNFVKNLFEKAVKTSAPALSSARR